jgi:hypothetical protein
MRKHPALKNAFVKPEAKLSEKESDMSQQIMKLFSVLFLAGIVLAGARAAYAFEITQVEPNGTVVACMDVAGGNTNSGTPVQAFPCNDTFGEQWSDVAGELQGLGTSASGANCADASGGVVILDACASPPGPWFLFPDNQVSVGEGCLDSQSEYGDGAQLAVTACNTNASSQVWVVKDIVIAQAIPNQIGNACVDVQDQAIKNNTPVLATPCTLGIGERWTYINGELRGVGTSDGKFTCLGTKEKKGVYLVGLQTCTSAADQFWYILSGTDSSGHYGVQLLNGLTQGCLDSRGNDEGAQLVVGSSICDAEGTTSQLWTLR